MGWFCPTFQRPERLAELALSWERCQPGTPLHVRVWADDPRKEDYFKYEWPKEWHLYVSGAEWAGEALNQYYDWNPNEPFYGFIGDDVVLRTKHGLDVLEQTAGRMFMAYPNDLLWRHAMPTHFCVGGDTARAMNFVTPRGLPHHYIDMGLLNIMQNCGLQRYCPHVIFQHKHFLLGYDVRDGTYDKIYGEGSMEEIAQRQQEGDPFEHLWKAWTATGELERTVQKLREGLVSQYERPQEWEEQDFEEMREVYEDESVLCDEKE